MCLWHNSTWYNANPAVPKMKDVAMFASTMAENITDRDDPEEGVFAEMYSSVCESAYPQVRPKPQETMGTHVGLRSCTRARARLRTLGRAGNGSTELTF